MLHVLSRVYVSHSTVCACKPDPPEVLVAAFVKGCKLHCARDGMLPQTSRNCRQGVDENEGADMYPTASARCGLERKKYETGTLSTHIHISQPRKYVFVENNIQHIACILCKAKTPRSRQSCFVPCAIEIMKMSSSFFAHTRAFGTDRNAICAQSATNTTM